MGRIAIKILINDKAKYIALIFGIVFSTFLMSQQMSLFVGIMSRTFSIVNQVPEVDIWVMDKRVQYIDGIEPIPDISLVKVRGIEGVNWATKFYKGSVVAKVNNKLQMVTLLGVDQVSMVGAPKKMIYGDFNDIKKPNAVIIDESGYKYIWPDEGFTANREFEANDRRMILVGVADIIPGFASPSILYTTYQNAINYSPQTRNNMSFVLVNVKDGYNPKHVAKNISDQTNLKALTSKEFENSTLNYYLTHTGIAINFGVTVALGFLVGSVISGQTFYIFISEKIKEFATLKAIGVNNGKIFNMVIIQALMICLIGFSIGIGLTSLFFSKIAQATTTFKGFFLPWQVILITFVSVVIIMLLVSIFSIRKVMITDPAMVFRG